MNVTLPPLLRTIQSEDLDTIARIYAHYVLHTTATFEITPPDRAEMENRMNAILGAGHPYLVAHCEGRILGFAYASQYRPRAAYRFTMEDSIYLDPEATGQGVGTALLRQLIRDCEMAGARQMVAVIGDSANAPSVRLHLKLGFQQTGILHAVGRKFGSWVDTVLLQRELIPSS